MPVCLLGFYFLYERKKEYWVYWINLCSVFFYGYWSINHLTIFISSICFNYVISKKIAEQKKTFLVIGIVANLLLLAYFKYTNFFIDIVNENLKAEWVSLDVILPIGISFFTFQQIAFLIDAYQKKAPKISFARYFFFVSFFPQLIAGPIVHHSEIFGQLGKYKKHTENFAIGFSIFSMGLFKKVFIADTLALTATPVFDYAQIGGNPSFAEAWIGIFAYTFQIYFDFSAYSDMAIGIARMFGLRLPQNFASPYKAHSITDFWRRWHITLSRFLRDYLYIPLGGNRSGYITQKANVFITMLLGGIWHGAGWTFIIWGALHGLFLIINHAFSDFRTVKKWPALPAFISWPLAFFFVVVAWVPFRAESLDATLTMWQSMFLLDGFKIKGSLPNSVTYRVASLLLICFIVCMFMPNTSEIFRAYRGALPTKGYVVTRVSAKWLKWRPNLVWACVIMTLFWLCMLKLNEPSEFLYFQF